MTKSLRTISILSVAMVSLVAGIPLAWADSYGLFPQNALNVRTDITNNNSWTAFTPASGSIYTVLYESMNTSDADINGGISIDCGGNKVLRINSFKLVPAVERFKMAKCANSLIAKVSGVGVSDLTTVSIIYVPYDIASHTFNDALNPLTASTSIQLLGHFDVGQIVMIILLFCLVMFNIFAVFRRHL